MPSTVVCTVGKSLVTNLPKGIYDLKDVKKALAFLESHKDPTNERNFGAEINSVSSLVEIGVLESLQNMYLFISDTSEGEFVGEVLKNFFTSNPFGLEFGFVNVVKIKGLTDSNPDVFIKKGLRNLVKELAKVYKNHSHDLLINATGGYKAQIALATVFGQAFGVPVYYKFETFNKIIQMPPLPMTISMDVVEKFLEIFTFLDCREEIPKNDLLNIMGCKSMGEIPRELKIFIDWDSRSVWLNHLGQIYFERAEIPYEKFAKIIKSRKDPEDKVIEPDDPTAQKLLRSKEIKRTLKRIASLELVESIRITAAGKIGTQKREIGVNVGDENSLKIHLRTSAGNLTAYVYLPERCTSEKVKEVLKQRIKSER